MTNTEQSREAFETYCRKNQYVTTQNHDGTYNWSNTQDAWLAWQSQQPEIDALKVEVEKYKTLHQSATRLMNEAQTREEEATGRIAELEAKLTSAEGVLPVLGDCYSFMPRPSLDPGLPHRRIMVTGVNVCDHATATAEIAKRDAMIAELSKENHSV
jgi:hypothetical protein